MGAGRPLSAVDKGMKSRWFCWVAAGVLASVAWGGEVVKSVDAEGRVTYSDRPVPGAVESQSLELAPAPDPEAAKAAQERLRRQQQAIEAAEAERRARAAARSQTKTKSAPKVEKGISEGGFHPTYPRLPVGPIRPRPPLEDHPAYQPRPPASPRPVRPRPR